MFIEGKTMTIKIYGTSIKVQGEVTMDSFAHHSNGETYYRLCDSVGELFSSLREQEAVNLCAALEPGKARLLKQCEEWITSLNVCVTHGPREKGMVVVADRRAA
jgi:hypothetical protein